MEPSESVLSREQKRFVSQYPKAKVVSGEDKTIAVYEREELFVSCYIVSAAGGVLDHECFFVGPEHLGRYEAYRQGLNISS